MKHSNGLNSKLILFTITDNSLSPELTRGEFAVCDPDAPLFEGTLVVAKIGGEYLLAKVGFDAKSGLKTLTPPRDGCPTLRIRSDRSGCIIGRVTSSVRCI